MVFYRVLELAVADPVRYRDLILNPRPNTTPRTPATRGRPASLDRPPADRPWRSANAPSSAQWIARTIIIVRESRTPG